MSAAMAVSTCPSTKVNPKFEEVLHYIISQCGDRPNVGKTVLYKILYFSDFDFYELHEKSLTNTTYRSIDNGPAPCSFDAAISDLKSKGLIEETHPLFRGRRQIKYRSLSEPKVDSLTAEEIKHVDREIKKLSSMNATQIAAYSHKDMPVKATKYGAIINYELVFYRDQTYSVREYGDEV